ncbi:M48 family metalloprotease [Erythrobacter sp. SCSIO 43205]|uniref:M48 family metalloprotease n=1 Tax=Erythrobacter sp. SCSIO 43205 TaxID=2779361 RepID=UPI001CA9A170|nr:M48 family metalloprotease [Erythrobacter sp. SCSIO 43205]UAB76910.1 M48 family metalloprotease [Erythrobacter sp. SCSIO 43205]
MTKFLRKTKFAGVASLTLALTACATTPIPGQTEAITQSEAQQGAQYHPQLVAEFGGEMTGPLAQYVEQVGLNVAVESGLGGARDSFEVTLLNSPVNNAFAVPGGYIYTTRQLVALMGSEAELAGVLAHEVGHVTARHAERRQRRAQRNQGIGVLGTILSSVLLGDSQLGNLLSRTAATAPQLLNLAYSREHEEESDRLGIDYMSRAGYDPKAMGDLLERLARQNALDAQLQGRQSASPPVWASSHPEPAARVRLANAYAEGKPGTVSNRDRFLDQIDGMIYGDDPAQGLVEGRDFLHPDLRLAFTAPQGFYMLNGTRAVTINGEGGQAQFTTASYNGDLQQYILQAFTAVGGQNSGLRPQRIERTRVNGLDAAYGQARVNNGQSQVDVTVFAYEFANDRAYHFVTITPAGGANPFTAMYQSVRRLSAAQAAQIIPRRLRVVTVQRGDTVAGLARQMAYDNAQVERFRVLNGLGDNEGLRAGQRVKLVVRAR